MRSKHAEYELNRYHALRIEAIMMLGGKCSSCGSVDNLEFDHINPKNKSFHISALWSISKQKFLIELKKCQLLCSTCHKIKTSAEKSVPHGGGKKGKRNCGCMPCLEKRREYNRWYAKNIRIR